MRCSERHRCDATALFEAIKSTVNRANICCPTFQGDIVRSVLLFLLLVATNASAEWTLMKRDDEISIYMDFATIRRSGDMAKAWELQDFTQPKRLADESPYLSAKVLWEYDCADERERIVAIQQFAGQMGGGKIGWTYHDSPMKWAPIAPGSVAVELWKRACRK